MKFATRLLHGVPPDEATGATVPPIFQTTAYRQETAEDMESIFAGRKPGFVYTRVGNPTVAALERRIAALEEGAGAVAFASGMAAVAAAVMNAVRCGDEIIAAGGLFGGTSDLFRELTSFGVAVSCVPESSPDAIESCITKNTKLIYVEAIGNPKLDIADIRALSRLAHGAGLPLFVDSTMATPYLVRPLSLGADIVIHSTSKAINGGGNSLGGIVVSGDKFAWDTSCFPKLADFSAFGPLRFLARLKARMATDFGGALSPFNAHLTGIGLDTLALRMERASANALALAEACAERGDVAVNYPGLSSSPGHALAKEQFGGRYGTMLTLCLATKERAFRFINSLRFALNVSNLGDARTLVVHPASTVFAQSSEEEKERAGVTDGLVRVSVGIEDIRDLVEDFGQALDAAYET